MDSLAAIARQRSVMATIADAITAAAVGRSLRVAIGWSNPGESAFADQLTQALLARGLPCRRLSARANPTDSGADRADAHGNSPVATGMVAVITSGAGGLDQSDLCRVDTHLHTPTRHTSTRPAAPSPHGAASSTRPADTPPTTVAGRTSSWTTSTRTGRSSATSFPP